MQKDKIKFLAILALFFLTLLAATIYRRSDFKFAYKGEEKKEPEFNARKYLEYIQTLKIDSQASKQLFQTLLTEKEIREEVEKKLSVSQAVKQPKVDQYGYKVSSSASTESVSKYLGQLTAETLDYNSKMSAYTDKLFKKDGEFSTEQAAENSRYVQNLLEIEIPQGLKPMHEAVVSSAVSYGQLARASDQYAKSPGQSNPWPEVYGSYLAINEQMKRFNSELEKVSGKYKISEIKLPTAYAQISGPQKISLIPKAQAFLGFGDITITIGDVPRIIRDVVEEGLTASFSQFMGEFLKEMVNKLETNYLVANFLYYSDALVSGQYVNDYLNKYVSDSLDKQIIKKFIPQFSCGKQDPNLNLVFKAKAQEFLGFDPEDISPSDPEYYQKMSRVGNFLSSEQGWKANFEEIAIQARSEAEKAVEKELSSSGLKTPRDLQERNINLSVSGIISAQRANLNALMQLGINNAQTFVSGFIAQLTQTLVNKFVFKGVSGPEGSVGVLKEQSTCVAAAQLTPVIPASLAEYQSPPPPPSQVDVLEQQCASLPRGCEGALEPTPTPQDGSL